MAYKSGQLFLPFSGRTDGRTDRILIARPRLHSMQRGKKLKPNWIPKLFNCEKRKTQRSWCASYKSTTEMDRRLTCRYTEWAGRMQRRLRLQTESVHEVWVWRCSLPCCSLAELHAPTQNTTSLHTGSSTKMVQIKLAKTYPSPCLHWASSFPLAADDCNDSRNGICMIHFTVIIIIIIFLDPLAQSRRRKYWS